MFFSWPLRIKVRDDKCCVTIGKTTNWISGRVKCFQKGITSGTNHAQNICPLNKYPSKQQSNHFPNCITTPKKPLFEKTLPKNHYFFGEKLKHIKTNIGHATENIPAPPKKNKQIRLEKDSSPVKTSKATSAKGTQPTSEKWGNCFLKKNFDPYNSQVGKKLTTSRECWRTPWQTRRWWHITNKPCVSTNCWTSLGVWPHTLSESYSFAFLEYSLTLIPDRHKPEAFAGASGFREHLFDLFNQISKLVCNLQARDLISLRNIPAAQVVDAWHKLNFNWKANP